MKGAQQKEEKIMIETYRDMDLIYTSYQEVQKDVLSQEHFSVTLCLDRQSEKEEKD